MIAAKQRGSHPGRRCRQLHRQVRTVTLVGLGTAIVAGGAACGDVHFVPAPFTPGNVQVVYSTQEDLSIIRWRVSSFDPLPDTQFQLEGPNGFQTIDFGQSVYAGGVNRCTDGAGSCAQYVVRGRYDTVTYGHPVRALHSLYGLLPGGPASTRTVGTTLAVDSFFRPHNDFVFVTLMDEVANDGPFSFPRAFDRAMWPTTGLCVSNIVPADVDFSPLGDAGGFAPATPLTDAGIYCVGARPQASDGSAGVVVEMRVATQPEVETSMFSYSPPVQKAPIIYQIILDLDIPVPDRCALAIATIEALLAKHMKGGGAPVFQLATINLATGGDGTASCSQVNGRSFAAAQIAQAVKDLVTTRPEVHQRYHLLYFNNLHELLPETLVSSFQALSSAFSSPPGYDLQMISWLFNPGEAAASSVGWTMMTHWVAADDPMFEVDVQTYTDATLPYTTELHDPGTPIDLLTPDQVQAHAGDLVKICSSSPPVSPMQGSLARTIETIDPAAPPAYLVAFNSQIAVPANQFVTNTVEGKYQICDRYCAGHPYVSDAGIGVDSWADSPLCAGKDY
jgi:hypothetical protein